MPGKRNDTRRIAFIAACVGLLGLAGAAYVSYMGHIRVCCICAMHRCSTTVVDFEVKSHFEESALSRVLYRDHLVGQHDHDWQYVHGGGPSVRCALGRARYVCMASDNAVLAEVIDRVSRIEGNAEAKRWLAHVLNPDCPSDIGFALAAWAGSAERIDDLAFRMWWHDTRPDIDQIAAECEGKTCLTH